MKTIKYILNAVVIVALLVSCGGEKEANIVITANDLMQYSLKEIKVKAGQKVKLTLKHVGTLSKDVMGHNVVILKPDVDMAEFVSLASTEKVNDYIPADTQDVIVHTKLIGGGETTTIEFDAPPAGTYTFLCSFPAHFAMMNGKFIVE